MTTTEIVEMDPEIRQSGSALQSVASELVVRDAATFEAAADFLKGLKSYRALVEEKFGPACKAAHEAWKRMTALRREADAPADLAEQEVKRKMLAWQREEEARRQERQRKAEEAARKEAEREARKLEKKGRIEEAEEVRATPAPVVVQSEVPKVSGISTRKVWRFEVVDAKALPREWMVPDEIKIGKVVKALGGQANIPGVRIWQEEQMAAGRV